MKKVLSILLIIVIMATYAGCQLFDSNRKNLEYDGIVIGPNKNAMVEDSGYIADPHIISLQLFTEESTPILCHMNRVQRQRQRTSVS